MLKKQFRVRNGNCNSHKGLAVCMCGCLCVCMCGYSLYMCLYVSGDL